MGRRRHCRFLDRRMGVRDAEVGRSGAGAGPGSAPLDKTISQYELRKAIRLRNGETKTILF